MATETETVLVTQSWPCEEGMDHEQAFLKASSFQLLHTDDDFLQTRAGADFHVFENPMTLVEAEDYAAAHGSEYDFTETVAVIRLIGDGEGVEEETGDDEEGKEQSEPSSAAVLSTGILEVAFTGRQPKVGSQDEYLVEAAIVAFDDDDIEAVRVEKIFRIEEQRTLRTVPSPSDRAGYAVHNEKGETILLTTSVADARKFIKGELSGADSPTTLSLEKVRLNEDATEIVGPETITLDVTQVAQLELAVIDPNVVEESDSKSEPKGDEPKVAEKADSSEPKFVGWFFFGRLDPLPVEEGDEPEVASKPEPESSAPKSKEATDADSPAVDRFAEE